MPTPRASKDKVTKGRGRPPGSRNSLSKGVKKANEETKDAPESKRMANAKENRGQPGAKKKTKPGPKAGKEGRRAKQRESPGGAEIMEAEEEDELSFTQPEVVPRTAKQSGRRQRELSGSAKKRGRPSRALEEQTVADDADERSAPSYVQLVPRTRRIAREVMETWPMVSPQIMDQIALMLSDAKKDIVNTQRDEQKAIAADDALRSLIRTLTRQLSSSRIPPQAKDIHFNIDKLTERYGELFRELTTERHSVQLLTEQIKVAQHLLKRDEEALEELKNNARKWRVTWERQEKQGRVRRQPDDDNEEEEDANVRQLHPLLKNLDGEGMDDGPDDIKLKPRKAIDVSMMDAPDADLAPHLEQLRRSLEDMQGNHEQVAGMEVGIGEAQAALDDMVFKRASAEEYAAL